MSEISLKAYDHIQSYLNNRQQAQISQEDLNAILRLSQHLRVFGLLSAVGYINQQNSQEGQIRTRTVPVWTSLLNQLLCPDQQLNRQQLMALVIDLQRNQPAQYLSQWRQSMTLSKHWNFWARACANN
ncbi:hypothetical protein [Synechocystis salina]|uniref:Uncharacterized protein n=1 Tax=Synechocystis salina LEGE 00031 TaxID=1828736 RepID=A0ABR9VW52_9SYNC|nr:hypothetical protein [Synechocystis salina]MBE9242216.1 hypothetical protein [Synechocystis salina LEGE 00041]MBE9254466.1 hypothetical protein [Synechocystis salina LEGE 00031]